MTSTPKRIGLIGAGYIAQWHADAIRATPGASLAAVCDLSLPQSQKLASAYGARAFQSVDDMFDAQICDAVHILTPPDSHMGLAIKSFEAGMDVLVEKPAALSEADTQDIAQAAQKAGRQFHVGHNFLGLPSYSRLKHTLAKGNLGRISNAELHWCFPLSPLRSGPYGIWLLRSRNNLILELMPHLMAFVVDLFGVPDIEHVSLGKPVTLPGGGSLPQSWRVLARVGDVDVSLTVSLVETVDDRSLTLRGSSARARLDFAADSLVIDAENNSDLVLNGLQRQTSASWQHLRAGTTNAAKQFASLNAKSPYALSFRGMMQTIYQPGQTNDPRFCGQSAIRVMRGLDRIKAHLPQDTQPPPATRKRKPKPKVVVIGGTGFVGRAVTRGLVARGQDVRVLSRSTHNPFADLPDQVELTPVSLHDSEGLHAAMEGTDTVFNFARSVDSDWQACLANDVAVAENIALAALRAQVRRLVYTGTIASYDMSDPDLVITEATPFAPDMSDRNLYARSKAECERRLMKMHHEADLPLVIVRPGIVVGAGGPLQHWGIGRWHGAGAVRVWGNGRNVLPFVLIGDTVDGLLKAAETEGIHGQSFNLVGPPMFTARDYFDAIAQELGARIRVSGSHPMAMYAVDSVKHMLKAHVLRRTGLTRSSLRDWKSRGHLSRFDTSRTCKTLGWVPEANPDAFAHSAIADANLFGF